MFIHSMYGAKFFHPILIWLILMQLGTFHRTALLLLPNRRGIRTKGNASLKAARRARALMLLEAESDDSASPIQNPEWRSSIIIHFKLERIIYSKIRFL